MHTFFNPNAPFPTWQQFLKRPDNIGLNVMQAKQKYLTEQTNYYRMIPVTPSFAAAVGGAGSTDTGVTPFTNTKSIDFDGTNDRINCGDSDSLSFGNGTDDSPFSISAWINVDDTSVNRIINKTTVSSGGEWLFTTGTAARTLVLNLYDHPATVHSGPYRGKAGTTSFNSYIGQWVHVAATYDGRGGDTANAGINLYFNAALESTTNITAGTYVAMSNTSSPVQIGADPSWTNNYMNGKIDEISVFNTALSSEDITNIYNSGTPNDLSSYSSLVHWWRMGDGDTFPTITDNKGNNDGTMTNMALDDIVENVPG